MISIQWRYPYLNDFIKETLNFGLQLDSPELISFKLCIMINTAKLYSLIPVDMTLTFIQLDKVTRKLEHVQLFCCNVT